MAATAPGQLAPRREQAIDLQLGPFVAHRSERHVEFDSLTANDLLLAGPRYASRSLGWESAA